MNLGQGKKNPVLRASRFQKAVGRTDDFFFTELTQKALVNPKIFRSLRWQFARKSGWFYDFFCKKKSKWGKKRSIGPVEQVFFPNGNISINRSHWSTFPAFSKMFNPACMKCTWKTKILKSWSKFNCYSFHWNYFILKTDSVKQMSVLLN